MILGGRWVYKKYKKSRAEKEELNKTASHKHDELLKANPTDTAKIAIEHLGSSTVTDQPSDLPPRYSGIDQSSSILPLSTRGVSPTVGSAMGPSRQSLLDLHGREETLSVPSYTQLASPTSTSLSSAPSLIATPLPNSAANQPMEIQVRGKWVWVPEDDQMPSNIPASAPIQSPSANDSPIVELSAASPHTEQLSASDSGRNSDEYQTRGFIAELDGKALSTDTSDNKPSITRYVTRPFE